MAGRTKKTIDPELERQLAAAPTQTPVQAVFTLRAGASKAAGADATRKAVDKVVAKASSAAKSAPHRVSVFPNIDSFAVSGTADLVRCLIDDPDVASAMANVQSEDVLIRPVKSKRVKKKR